MLNTLTKYVVYQVNLFDIRNFKVGHMTLLVKMTNCNYAVVYPVFTHTAIDIPSKPVKPLVLTRD